MNEPAIYFTTDTRCCCGAGVGNFTTPHMGACPARCNADLTVGYPPVWVYCCDKTRGHTGTHRAPDRTTPGTMTW